MTQSARISLICAIAALVLVGCYEDNEIEPIADATVPECTGDETRECAVEGGCLGSQTCNDGFFGECQAPDEVCDGIDNDCDDSTDEGYAGLGDPCTAGDGVCADKGTNVCNAAGDGVECNAVAGDGTDEVCDGVDNDCDGEIDDDVPVGEACDTGRLGACSAGATICEDGDTRCAPSAEPTDEVCDGIDNDCDGRSDESDAGGPIVEACYDGPEGTEGVGACAAGVTVCTDGALGACADQVTPADEICDGIDNDCDGEIDNVDGVDCVCVPGETQPCYAGPEGTEGVGVCQGGIQACNEDGTAYGECEGMVMPGVELCDARDNDCNGEIDDAAGVGDACSVGQGLCAADGARVCDLESGQVVCDAEAGLPEDEICDGVDNDCDGVDDDVPGAGDPCTVGEGACLARGILVCGKGDGGGLVCNASAGEPGDEICDGIDNDCNGEIDDVPGVGEACEVGVGQCRSTAVAVCDVAAGEVLCPATEQAAGLELCDNGLDEDCDGETDEDECTTPCVDEGDCGPGLFCEDNACVPGCQDDDGCGFREICEDALCVPGCRDDDGCGVDELCEDSACVPGNCREDVDCGDGSLCIDSFCVVGDCRGDEDCADAQICSANSCIDLPGECEDPAAIGFGELVGSTADAGDDFQGSCNPNSPDVVFRLDAGDYVGTVCATTDGSDYDTKLFARSDCGREDTEIDCNDDGGVGTDSQIQFDVDGDSDAFIFVDGFNGNSGNFVLTVTEGPCACRADDQCAEGETCRLGACVVPECGDGIIDGDEVCDDGNAEAGDGCSDACAVEDGYTCDALTGLCQLNNGLFGSVQRLPGEQLPENSLADAGEAFENECDENEVIYGAEAALGAGIDRMRALCADIELAGDRLVLDPAPATDSVGNPDAEFNQRIVCPPNHAVSGYVAYAPAGISLLCTPVTLEDGRLSFGEPVESPILGVGLAEISREACGANAAAGAHAGRADDVGVYAFSLRCDTFTDLCDAPSICAPIGDCFTDDDCEDGETCTDFVCIGTEICDDGFGNNGNEQVDCFDGASCAEHPACIAGACESPEDCEGAPCVDGVCAVDAGDEAIAIAQPGHHVATAGELDAEDPTWERPAAACTGGGPDGAKFYETRTIVNETGARQQVTIQTADPDFDGFVHVFADPFDAALTPEGCIAGNDDSAPGSRVTNVDMAPGERLVIVVSTFGDNVTGAYTVDIRTQSPIEACDDGLDNDDDALVDCDDPDCALTAVCAECGDDVVSEGEECDDGNLDPIDGCDAECNIEVEICDNQIDDEGDGAIDCDDPDCALDPACLEPVGSCEAPTLLEGPGVVEGSTAGQPANDNETDEDCVTFGVGQALSPEAVIAFSPVEDGVYCLNTVGSAFDTVLYVRQDECANPDAEVACNDDNRPITGGTRSALDLDAVAASTYFVFVDGFGENNSGDFILTVTEGPCAPPLPDEICDDGEDNDEDGATDCDDPDCADDPLCVLLPAEICDDLIDNDLDGATDCDDPDCAADPACAPPGDETIAFVTSTIQTGDLGGLAGADGICNDLAAAAGLPGTYLAWLSTDDESPATRFVRSDGPYVTTTGVRIADNWADLTDGTLAAAISGDENGDEPAATNNWTGTEFDGTGRGPNCLGWTSADNAEMGWTGDSSNPPQAPEWWSSRRELGCNFERGRIYCFQQPGPVVVAEICDDGEDNDEDGATDCDDPDCADDPACAPRIAACDAPFPIDGPGLYEGSTAGASNDVVTSACQANANGNEVAFSLTTPVPATLCLTSTGFDTILYARTGDCATGEAAGCNDDDGPDVPGNGSRLELTTEAGVDYFVFLDGWDGAGGDYRLEVVAGTCAQPGVELCDNAADDDANGLVDCDDPACALDDACREPTPEVCDDGIDNDIDGGTDCDDADCVDDPACAVVVEICDDGIDNDGDGQLDCAINGCAVDPLCVDHGLCTFGGPVAGPFGSRGDAFWFQDEDAGGYSSGDVDDNQQSILRLQKTLPTGGRIGFEYSVSSEPTFDFLEFYIDGGLVDRWTGNVDWTRVSYDLAPGAHDFEWRYIKDESTSIGDDRGLIRMLTFIADDVCPPVDAEVCDDGIDNDFDGETDCADADCAGDAACPAGTCPADDRFEPNDDRANATPLMPGRYDDLARCTNDDYYAIDVCGGGTITVDAFFIDADGDIDLQLLDADGVVRSSTSGTDEEQVEYTLPTDDPAQLVARIFFADNSYSLGVAVTCPELCGNAGDDDGDGAVDCDDPDCVDDAACNPLRTEVELDPTRETVNTGEANVGNLAADAILWQGQGYAAANGGPSPAIALTNGGGFRGEIIPADSELTDEVLGALFPFGNTVVIVEAVERVELYAMLENAVSNVEGQAGRFAQISGFQFIWDSDALVGERVRTIILDDGTVIAEDFRFVDGPPVVMATNSFIAADQDGYVFPDAQADTAVTVADALKGYIIDQLDGVVTEAAYPIGGEGRITALVAEQAGVNCDDGVDNDANGFGDCADPACSDDPACAQPDVCLGDGDCVGNAVCRGLPGVCVPVGVCAPGGDAYEPNDTAETARALPGDGRYSPAATCGEDDFYSVGVCPGGTLNITVYFSHNGGDIDLEVIDGPASDSANDDETVAVTNDGADPVDYVWQVFGFNGQTNGYAMDVTIEGCGVEDLCEDGEDNDNDGAIDCADADCVDDPACAPGAVVITEVMQNPAAVSDNNGEWFEVYNDTGADLDLEGWSFSEADGGNRFTIVGALPLPAGGYLVLGKNGDEATNGGVPVDYVFGADMALGNSSDDISVFNRAGEVVSAVAWDNGATFPDPSGASMQFDARLEPTVDNTADGANWCEGLTAYGDGDFGTPGAANEPCGPIDGAPVPIADLSQSIAFDGAIEDGDALWELPNADCTPRGDGRMYAYDSHQIVNETGDAQFLDVTAFLPDDGSGDGMLHIFDGDFDPAVLDNCLVGGDNGDGGGFFESFVGGVPIAPGQILTLVLTSELPVPDGRLAPIGGATLVYFGGYIIDVLTAAPKGADFCRLQFPAEIEGAEGETVTVFGRLFETGFTDRSTRVDQFSRIEGQLGYLPDGADPMDPDAWTWIDAEPNRQYDGEAAGEPNNDEYQADLVLPAEGLYSYAFRFSVDSGVSYQMCDLDGAGANDDAGDFSIDQAGLMLVAASACGQACEDLEGCGFLGLPVAGVPADRAECDQACADGLITEEQAQCLADGLDPAQGQCGFQTLQACQ